MFILAFLMLIVSDMYQRHIASGERCSRSGKYSYLRLGLGFFFILNKISLLGIVLKFFPVFLKPGRACAGVSMCDVDTQLSSFFKCWAGPVLLDEPGESHCLVAGQGPRDGAA